MEPVTLALIGAGLIFLLKAREKDLSQRTFSFSSEIEEWRDEATVKQRAFAPDIPIDVILSVIQQESGGSIYARGSAGELGLMQLKDGAARDVGFDGATLAPNTNIEQGVKYLQLQFDRVSGVPRFRGNELYHTLRAYNAGFGGATSSDAAGARYAREVLARI